jgi:chloride channel protein, CIC family
MGRVRTPSYVSSLLLALAARLPRRAAPEATGKSQRAWLVLAAAIGIVAGLGAVVFYDGLRLTTRFLLTDIGGYTPAGTAGEGGRQLASGFSRPWAIPLVVGGGALVAGALVFRFAPEAEGHGTDAAINAVHTNPTGIRPRAIVVKLVASVITIGSGGSGGREGPTAQISAGFGSALARRLRLSPADARLCVAAGMASGIAAIFRAPLGGALLGAELLYRDDIAVEGLIPSLVASVVAFAVFSGITGGSSPIFGYHAGYQLGHGWELALFAVLGIVCGLVGRGYVTAFYGATAAFARLRIPRPFKAGIAGLAVGALGLAVPGVLGTGYGQIQTELNNHQLLAMSVLTVFAVPVAKIAATSLSIGSGGSGGIFGPGMVIGGATGAALWRTAELCGLHTHDQAAFVIVGMMACFGAVAHAPLAVMVMVAEMTGNVSLLPAAMTAIVIAVMVVGDTTIYRSQPATRSTILVPT